MISADFVSTGDRVVLVFADGSPALVVDLESGTERPLPDMPGGVVSAAFTPDDDRIVAVAGAGAAWVFNARTLNRDRELEDGGVVAGFVVPPPVLDAGGTLLFSAADGVARLWHVESGRQIGKPLPAQAGGRPWGVADSETLRVVTPHDGNALIWNLEVDEWVELACSAAGRNMTRRSGRSSGHEIPNSAPRAQDCDGSRHELEATRSGRTGDGGAGCCMW